MVWELSQLLDPSSGRFYEIDLLVLGYSAIYLLELKGGPGRYKGDSQDWYREVPGERTHYMDPPLRLTDFKCKVLKSMLQRHMRDRPCPRIVPLVFLSHPDVELALRSDGLTGVVTRGTLQKALTHHEFPGSPASYRGKPIDKPTIKAVLDAAKAIGLKPRKSREIVGSYERGEVLDEGSGYQDRLAIHQTMKGMRRRARVYLVPEQTSIERRQQLKRAADREVGVLLDVRGSPFILSCTEYVPSAERGPTVLFDDFAGGLPLDAFLRGDRSGHVDQALTFDDKLSILAQLADALSYCHKRGVFHGAVAPGSVLVRRSPDSHKIEIRLFNFQLASGDRTPGTLHWSQLAAEAWAVYQAPELREDPAARSIACDVFGLGAIAYLLFTGEAPGKTALEVELRLRRDRFLDPRVVDASLPDAVVAALQLATELAAPQRADDALEWFQLLEGALTEPDAPRVPVVSPLDADPGSILEGGLLVQRVLGHGASSRVLEVLRESDNREYALKVSLSEEHDPRLRAEARVLRAVRDQRIVEILDECVIGGRVCLLLERDGERTLHQELTSQGSVSLDYAARYGEDLLSALEALERKGLIHRDIKPANLGIGAVGKEAKRLRLFDFSLADVPLTELAVGTAAYRDPFLRGRGAWDHAADRYSAAVTLHEMLTGVRPSWDGEGGSALDDRSELTLAAERFDAAARDGLLKFFRQALARSLEERFASASDMRKAWERALEEPRRTPSVHPDEGARAEPSNLTDADYKAIGPATSIEGLPLSTRAKNALDRAGISRVEQLRPLATNKLSAIRGIGTKVAEEILLFRKGWLAAQGSGVEVELFSGGYRGEDLTLEALALSADQVRALGNTGITGLSSLAAAPKEQVLAIAVREGFEARALKQRLDDEQQRLAEREHPTTIEGLLAAFLPKSGKGRQYLELLFGLAAPFEGRLDVPATHVAKHFGITAPNLYILLSKQRAHWAAHGLADEVVGRALDIVREHGGAVSLSLAAQSLLARVEPRAQVDALQVARAAGVLRIAAELERERSGQLHYVRLGEREPWLFDREVDAERLTQLGVGADALAERDPLASPAEAARKLALLVEGSALSALTPARLLELACAASKTAACSSRLEIYPRGLAPERVIALSAQVLKGGVSAEEVSQRVHERYPLSAPLPSRPELDSLMQGSGFEWREGEQAYARPGEASRTNLATQIASQSRFTTAPTGQPRRQSKAALSALDFDQRLRAALEDDAFRVIGVSIDRGPDAVRLLGKSMNVAATSFDALFLRTLVSLTESGKPSLELVKRADAEGQGNSGWANLQKLAQKCAERVLAELLPAQAPLLLYQLGLVARYELSDFMIKLVEGAAQRDSRAVFLVLPCPDSGAAPRINGTLSIPGLLPGQALWVPPEWLKNTHNAAA